MLDRKCGLEQMEKIEQFCFLGKTRIIRKSKQGEFCHIGRLNNFQTISFETKERCKCTYSHLRWYFLFL